MGRESLFATGNVVAWQEAIIAPEIGGEQIVQVQADVGDWVKKGQLLARLSDTTLKNDVAEMDAALSEAKGAADEASANAARAAQLRERGFYSEQTNMQYQTAAHTAKARYLAMQARAQKARTYLAKSKIVAPDDGVISAKTATVGSVAQANVPLFHLIAQGRLEWQAEVPSEKLAQVTAGQNARLFLPDGTKITALVRARASAIDPKTRNGLVYVDLPISPALHAGMFLKGEVLLAEKKVLTVPETALRLNDGFAFVFVPEKEETNEKIKLHKVTLGQRHKGRVEVVEGVDEMTRIIETGVAFLSEGDVVKIAPSSASTK